eukprot:TRINITY_DN14433_c0_g1_i1.p1 TRINITY_DN14433_c0_g1~~TRINITY_DN14433_c0_g1_i1.p1  ORF type:complete len:355 (-),score=33.03 TRINITY_DN14433_c0_g1_i1:37-1101(-)
MPRRDETEEQRYLRKEAERAERRKLRQAQEQSDSAMVVKLLCVLACLNAFCVMVPVFGPSWGQARFTGIGVALIDIRTSMFTITVEMNCEKNAIENAMCEAARGMEGHHYLHSARSLACAISTNACSTMGQIFWTAFIIFSTFSLAFIFHMLAALFLFYYWYEKPLAKVRNWAVAFFMAAPMITAVGLGAWSAITPNLADLPRGWNPLGFAGYRAASAECPFGWCWWWSVAAIVVSLLTVTLIPCFLHPHESEEQAEAEELYGKECAAQDVIAEAEKQCLREYAGAPHGVGVPMPGSSGSTMVPPSGATSYGYGSSAGTSYMGASQPGYGQYGAPNYGAQAYGPQGGYAQGAAW